MKNWPELKDGQKVVDCPNCGKKCIARPELESLAEKYYKITAALCTECTVRHTIKTSYEAKNTNRDQEDARKSHYTP